MHERFNQQIVVQAYPAPGGQDPWSETAEAVAAILGGENSRFYWQIVQEGLAPRAGVWRVDYSDCGLMVLSAQCEPAFCDEVMEAMTHEAQRLIREGATEDEVQRVKNIRRTHIAVESETPYYRLGLLLDDLEYYGRPRTVAERLAEVDAVTTRRVAEYLERFPITTGGHAFSVGPRDWMPASA